MNEALIQRFNERLKAGKAVFGPFMKTCDPGFVEAMNTIVKAAKQRGAVVGTFTNSKETMEMWAKAGVQYISYSVDMGIFYQACKNLKEQFHGCCEAVC